jgi:hypothetical protein
MKTQQELIDDLKALGESPQEIYSNLLREGYKGVMGEEKLCPVAMYLRVKGYESPSVGDDCISIENVDMGGMGGVCPEESLRVFIQNFDEGLYPDLDCGPIQTEST